MAYINDLSRPDCIHFALANEAGCVRTLSFIRVIIFREIQGILEARFVSTFLTEISNEDISKSPLSPLTMNATKQHMLWQQ